jgi:hypothetical protein
MKPNSEGVLPYKNIFDALKKVHLYPVIIEDCPKRRGHGIIRWFPDVLCEDCPPCNDNSSHPRLFYG